MEVKAYHVFRTFVVFVITPRSEINRFRMFRKNSGKPRIYFSHFSGYFWLLGKT